MPRVGTDGGPAADDALVDEVYDVEDVEDAADVEDPADVEDAADARLAALTDELREGARHDGAAAAGKLRLVARLVRLVAATAGPARP